MNYYFLPPLDSDFSLRSLVVQLAGLLLVIVRGWLSFAVFLCKTSCFVSIYRYNLYILIKL